MEPSRQSTVMLGNVVNTMIIRGCAIQYLGSGESTEVAQHRLFEIIYCRQGTPSVIEQGCVYVLKPGDWFVVKKGMVHHMFNNCDTTSSCLHLHVDIDLPHVRSALQSSRFGHYYSLNTAQPTKLPALAQELEQLFQTVLKADICPARNMHILPEEHILTLEACALLIVRELYALNQKQKIDTIQSSSELTSYEYELAARIRNEIENIFASSSEPISLVSRRLGFSAAHCSRIFKIAFGSSPRDFVTNLKIRKSKELIVSTTLSMEDIAAQLGYASAKSFSRQFQRWTGIAPTRLRPKLAQHTFNN